MKFILLTFLAAFSIEGLGTLVSVIGLSTLFGSNPIIIALAISLDLGKLVVVSLLYTYWDKLGKIMKSYALLAGTITMIITSAGAAGYLSGEFQKAILGTQEGSLKVDVLKGQQAKYEERKAQIDDQIAKLPEKTTVNQRIRLVNTFKAEQKELQTKISEIDKQLPELQIKQIGTEAKAGPILYISKAFDIPVESAVKWVILMIIFVFDPLAVFLIIAGNFLLHQRRLHKDTAVADADLFSDPATGLPVPSTYPPMPEVKPPAVEPENDPPAAKDEFTWPSIPLGTSTVGSPEVKNPDVLLPAWLPEWLLKQNETSSEVIPAPEVLPEPEPELVPEPEVLPEPKAIEAIGEVLAKSAADTVDGIHFRDPTPEAPIELIPLADDTKHLEALDRETITLSSLGFVRPDPDTIVDASDEIGYRTGVYKSGPAIRS